MGYTSDVAGLYQCKNIRNDITAINLQDVRAKCYLMPKWEGAQGREEIKLENEFIAAVMLTPLIVP